MTPEQLEGVRKHAVQHFIQSALLIDDEAIMGGAVEEVPKEAKRANASVLAAAPASDAAGTLPPVSNQTPPVKAKEGEAAPAARGKEGVAAEPPVLAPISSPLDAKKLTDAFLAQSIICGVFRPEHGEDPVQLSSKSAAHADIVIVDWFLGEKTSAQAKAIVLALLKSDLKSHGRLRLIVIYTNNPGRQAMAEELHAATEADAEMTSRLRIENGALLGTSTRIVFVNKAGTTGAAAGEAVDEEKLPERLMTEFSVLTKGLLPTFAVSAIAVVRDAVPHILSLFSESLDGSYAAHRAALPDPDDALDFAVDLISDELRNVIVNYEIAERHLGTDVLHAWIDGPGARQFSNGTTMLEADAMKQLLSKGAEGFKDAPWKKHGQSNQESKKVPPSQVSRLFYDSDAAALSANKRLARLSLFRNEALGPGPMPLSWKPFLSLGSVIRPIEVADGEADYLICLQPGCDSVRLEGVTSFPFQKASDAQERFNVVVKHEPGGDGSTAKIEWKPRDGLMIEFEPTHSGRVYGVKDEESGAFIFTAKSERRYRWIGDLKQLKAQSIVSQIGSRMQSVALDDLEWLRRQNE